jgi:hypothetical protein
MQLAVLRGLNPFKDSYVCGIAPTGIQQGIEIREKGSPIGR